MLDRAKTSLLGMMKKNVYITLFLNMLRNKVIRQKVCFGLLMVLILLHHHGNLRIEAKNIIYVTVRKKRKINWP